MTAVQKLIATVAAIIVIGGGIYFLSGGSAGSPSGISTSTTPGTATSTATSTGTGSATIVIPDYKKPIAFSADISADIRSQLNSELKVVQGQITQNPLNIKPWIDLGALHKMGGDYQNAALYWEYVAETYTGPVVPYLSLGDLYENYLHNYTKAETNYKAAIAANPQNVNAYADLYTMYHFTLKDDTKAAAILAQGLKENPGNNYLLGLQKELNSSQ